MRALNRSVHESACQGPQPQLPSSPHRSVEGPGDQVGAPAADQLMLGWDAPSVNSHAHSPRRCEPWVCGRIRSLSMNCSD